MAITRGASAPGDDSDLEDLITKSPGNKRMSNVEIDGGGGGSGGGMFMSPLGMISGACRLCCYEFPHCIKFIMFMLAMGFMAFLSNTLFSPTKKMGIMGADYSGINSAYDLSLSKVHHWCIQGDNDSCKCEDPLESNSRSEFKSWNAAHRANVADVNLYRAVYGSEPTTIDKDTGKSRPPIDVAFLGESVVEAMDGRWLGKRVVKAIVNNGNEREGPQSPKKPDIGKVFERLFRKEKGGPVEGVALGIAGDNTANVLWRLQHNEMPYDFNPKVWWLVLGMNDLTRMQCSEEIVVLGILRIVEEIRLRKPDAKIVINSLLPMINFQREEQVKMADFADFKSDKGDAMRENMEVDKAVKKFFGDKGPDRGGNRSDGGAGGRQDGFKEHGFTKGNKGGNRIRKLRNRGGRENHVEQGRNENLRSRPKRKQTKKERMEEEDNADKGPALEAALERRKKILEARDRRFRNKVFKDDEQYKPKRPVNPFLPMIRKHAMPPVWPAVHLINDKLREFCGKHESITFFDSTSIFAADEGNGRHRLHNELISPRGHPSELGFAVWEGQIMGRLHKLIMEKMEERVSHPPVDMDDDDVQTVEEDSEVEEDPEVEEISKMTMKDSADKSKGNDVEDKEVSGEGEEGQSDGKENDPPIVPEQPSRSEGGSAKQKKIEDGNAKQKNRSDGGNAEQKKRSDGGDAKEEKRPDGGDAKEEKRPDGGDAKEEKRHDGGDAKKKKRSDGGDAKEKKIEDKKEDEEEVSPEEEKDENEKEGSAEKEDEDEEEEEASAEEEDKEGDDEDEGEDNGDEGDDDDNEEEE